MKLLDLVSKKNTSESIEHRINPVYDTAKDCLVNLVHAGCEEAIRLNNELKFGHDKEKYTAIDKGTALFQETRYRFINYEIEKSGLKNILDIGCGYSPRGLYLSGAGYRYVGADLPATIKELKPAVDKCAAAGTDINYISVDATDPQGLVNAAGALDGPVCIITEGLFMYLPPYELNEYIKGVKAILELHGGCILTPDFCMNKLFKTAIGATSSKTMGNVLQKFAGTIVKQYTVASNDDMDPSVWYSEESDEEPYQYFAGKGFDIERIAVYNPEIKINSFDFVKKNKLDQLVEKYKNIYAWKLTAAGAL